MARKGSTQRCGMATHSHKIYRASGRWSGLKKAGNPRTQYQVAVLTKVAAKRIVGIGNGLNAIRSEGGIWFARRLTEARNVQ